MDAAYSWGIARSRTARVTQAAQSWSSGSIGPARAMAALTKRALRRSSLKKSFSLEDGHDLVNRVRDRRFGYIGVRIREEDHEIRRSLPVGEEFPQRRSGSLEQQRRAGARSCDHGPRAHRALRHRDPSEAAFPQLCDAPTLASWPSRRAGASRDGRAGSIKTWAAVADSSRPRRSEPVRSRSWCGPRTRRCSFSPKSYFETLRQAPQTATPLRSFSRRPTPQTGVSSSSRDRSSAPCRISHYPRR